MANVMLSAIGVNNSIPLGLFVAIGIVGVAIAGTLP
jgi:hypothetical protein